MEEWKGASSGIEPDEFTNRMPAGLFVNKKRKPLPAAAEGATLPDPGTPAPQPEGTEGEHDA